jgi:hypothetical protein
MACHACETMRPQRLYREAQDNSGESRADFNECAEFDGFLRQNGKTGKNGEGRGTWFARAHALRGHAGIDAPRRV